MSTHPSPGGTAGTTVTPRSLSTDLSRRFADLPRREIHALCDLPTLADALVAAVSLLHGAAAHVGERTDRPFPTMRNLVVGYRLDEVPGWASGEIEDPALTTGVPEKAGVPGRIAIIQSVHVPISSWEHPDAGRYGMRRKQRWNRRRLRRMERLDILTTALSGAKVAVMTIDDCVRPPCVPDTWWHSIGLPLWWDARLAEGHSPDSARMMLGLIVTPDMLARMGFTSTGHPTLLPLRTRLAAG